VSDYVPYEIRRENERREREKACAEKHDDHAAEFANVARALTDLDGGGTDFYIEVLRPARTWDRFSTSKPKVTLDWVSGGPNFVIDNVIAVYRLPDAIHIPYRKDPGAMVFDAYVVPDGRVWQHAGAKNGENVVQLLAATVEQVADLSTDNLRRVAEALRRVRSEGDT
jgi:hypothetical protein